jgi:hypothetical protein
MPQPLLAYPALENAVYNNGSSAQLDHGAVRDCPQLRSIPAGVTTGFCGAGIALTLRLNRSSEGTINNFCIRSSLIGIDVEEYFASDGDRRGFGQFEQYNPPCLFA